MLLLPFPRHCVKAMLNFTLWRCPSNACSQLLVSSTWQPLIQAKTPPQSLYHCLLATDRVGLLCFLLLFQFKYKTYSFSVKAFRRLSNRAGPRVSCRAKQLLRWQCCRQVPRP